MVTIYTMPGCTWCEKAKELAETYNITYQLKDVLESDVMNELKEKISVVRTVPQIFWDDRHVGGYQEFATEIENTLGGYGEQDHSR